MAVSLFPEARKQAWSSIRRFCAETLDLDVPVDDHQAAALLAFFLKDMVPSGYNAADAGTARA